MSGFKPEFSEVQVIALTEQRRRAYRGGEDGARSLCGRVVSAVIKCVLPERNTNPLLGIWRWGDRGR